MKKFWILRITAFATLGFVAVSLALTLISGMSHLVQPDWWTVTAVLLFVGCMGVHSIMILHVYKRFYPAGLIPKSTLVLFRIADVISIIYVLLCMALVVMSIFFPEFGGTTDYPGIRYRELTIGALLAAAFLIQIVVGEKMVKTIGANAQQQLDNSFA